MRLALPPNSCKVYTPAALAQAIVFAMGDVPHGTWLEPSHGRGVFLEAIARLGVRKDRVVAVDLDRTPVDADRLAKTIRGVDFLRWAQVTDRRFDRIVGNPPFISISKLPSSLQSSAASVLNIDGRPIGCGSNVWYAFVLSSLRLLKPEGTLAFVLPSSAEFADYSSALRRSLTSHFHTFELLRCESPLFDDVQEGTLVAVARGFGSGPGVVRRRRYASKALLIKGLSKRETINGQKCPVLRNRGSKAVTSVGSIASIGLGGVTGDSTYFLMNEEKRVSNGLPLESLLPVLSRAKHLQGAYLRLEDWEDLRVQGERVWLFNPQEEVALHASVRRYLRLKQEKGGCNRDAFKVASRNPWYRTSMPKVPDAFLSGMSQYGPWLCINETRRVNANNTLYVVRFASRDRNEWYKWALALLSSESQRQIRRIGRRYPEGLIKYEPGGLMSIMLPSPKRVVRDYKQHYARAIDALLNGRIGMAKEIADAFFE